MVALSFQAVGAELRVGDPTGTAAGRVEGEPIRYLPHHFQRSLPESLEGEVCRRYRAGDSSEALARVFGVGPTAILGALRRNGIDIRSSAAGEPLAPEQEAEICRRYAAGEKPKALAEAFGISRSGVLKILERSGVPRRYWQAISPERQAEICRRYLMGDKIADIAADAGINLTSIYGVLKRNGIKAHRQRQASLSE